MKGRFAPTPSGEMHLGNALSALLCWLSARSQGGSLVLRVEDLDLLRTSPGLTRQIEEDMRWLGLDWDEGPGQDGGNGPYQQSLRGTFYEECLAELEEKGLLYPCFCSRAELHAATAPHQSDGSYVYSGACRNLTPAQRAEKERAGAVRVRVPSESICVEDGLQGEICQNLAAECGDFILRRSDGVFAYQLCAPADDGAMGVTEVVRGSDLLPSAPRQAWLMQTLGYMPPRFIHTPMLLAPDGRRLSKRDGDLSLASIREKGARPEEVVGQLGFLCGLVETPAPLSARELLSLFGWQKVQKEDIRLPEGFAAQLIGK